MEDLTQGSITKHLIKMAVPMTVGLFVQVLYFLIDLYFVGRLGGDAIAAVSSAGTLFFLFMGLTQVLNIGCATLVSHAVGSKQATQANFVFNQAVSLALWATLITALLGYGLANAFFTILAPDNATKALSLKYFYWFFPSLLIQFSMTAFAAGLRGSGVVKPVMLISMLGLLINIVLSPVLIEGWFLGTALGVQGAGLASSVAAILSFGLVLRYFKKNDGYLTLTQFSLKLDRPTIKKLLKIGLPSGGEFLLTFIYIPMPPQKARFRTTGALQFEARQ